MHASGPTAQTRRHIEAGLEDVFGSFAADVEDKHTTLLCHEVPESVCRVRLVLLLVVRLGILASCDVTVASETPSRHVAFAQPDAVASPLLYPLFSCHAFEMMPNVIANAMAFISIQYAQMIPCKSFPFVSATAGIIQTPHSIISTLAQNASSKQKLQMCPKIGGNISLPFLHACDCYGSTKDRALGCHLQSHSAS